MTRLFLATKLIWLLALGTVAASVENAEAAPFKSVGDSVVHQPSGVSFPSKIGRFARRGPRYYDRTGRDVSMHYEADRLILADAHVYPVSRITGGLDSEFRRQQTAIGQINRNVKLLSVEAIRTNQNGHALSGKHATYNLERRLFSGGNVQAESQ